MEKQVNELILKIMYNKDIDLNDLNQMVELHKTIINSKTRNKWQTIRLEKALKDKIKEICVFLSDDYLNEVINMLFNKGGNGDIKDLRLIKNNAVAVIRERSIDLCHLYCNADRLSAGECLYEEAYLTVASRTREDPDNYNPKEVFSDFYSDMNTKIKDLKEKLDIEDRNATLYFNRNLDSFFFDKWDSFLAVVTQLPNIIEIYEIDATGEKWSAKKINGEELKDLMESNDFSLIQENFMIAELKKNYNGRFIPGKNHELDIEMTFSEFRKTPFSLEILIQTYNNLFNNSNCMYEENEKAIDRLRFLTAEKLVELGYEYKKALNYSNAIFEKIKMYKQQIVDAINERNIFPQDSLIGSVKKVRKP